ncbi:MAG: hypothetical protein KAR54_00910 [Candidatus Pacebacteria bacterium]|nr:hypothetical protein [Candidatus Paceibacterota bacterium]
MLNFNSKQIVKQFLSELPERSRDIITQRYGLGNNPKRYTLESIGQKYNITRERVRQIENQSLKNICNSGSFNDAEYVFKELMTIIESIGGIVAEDSLLEYLSENKSEQNNLYFFLILSNSFIKEKNIPEFEARWFLDKTLSNNVTDVLNNVHKKFNGDDLMNEDDLMSLVKKEIKKSKNIKEFNQEYVNRWLDLSKVIAKNPFGEWGLAMSQNIKIRGVRGHAYLIVRQNGSPMHFTEVAKMISKHFGKKVHTATCHNELIKDERFVLVGRGLYGLSEWGYSKGIVKDVVRDILKKNGPLAKEDIIEKVLRERYVKENTILVNLQNSDFFKKNSNGKYSLISK